MRAITTALELHRINTGELQASRPYREELRDELLADVAVWQSRCLFDQILLTLVRCALEEKL